MDTMESKIRTRSQTSSIIRRAIQYLQSTKTVVHWLSDEFLELGKMFRDFVRDHNNVAGMNDVAEKAKQFLTDMEKTINRNIRDRSTKLHHLTFDANESVLSPSDVALAEDLIRCYYRAARLWVVVNELMLGLMAAFPDFGEPVWRFDPTSEEMEEIHEALDEASKTLASLKSQDIPLEVAFDQFCDHDEKANPMIAWRDLHLSLEFEEDYVPCH